MANIDDKKAMRAYKLRISLIRKIEAKAKKERRTPHYIVIEALENAFKSK